MRTVIFVMCSSSNRIRKAVVLMLALPLASPSLQQFDISTLPSKNTIAALRSIVTTQYATRSTSFTLSFNAVNTPLLYSIEDILDAFIKDLNGITVAIEGRGQPARHSFFRMHNVLVVDGLTSLDSLKITNLTKDYDVVEYYVIYLFQGNTTSSVPHDVIKKIFEYFWQNSIINISLLHQTSENMAELFSFYQFMEKGNCKDIFVKRINAYTDYWHESIQENIFIKRLENFHQCPITAAVLDTPPFVIFLPNSTALSKLGGVEGQILEVIAEKLNFSIRFLVPPQKRGKLFKNGTATGAFGLLLEKSADVTFGSYTNSPLRSKFLTPAYPYYQTFLVYTVALSSRRYTSLEMLSMVFDGTTWVCIFLTLPLAMVTVFLVQRFRNYSYLARLITNSKQTGSSLFGIIGIFLGTSLSRKPRATFTRFIVFCLLVYGIVIRTAYQTLLFSLLQTDLYHKPPATLDDLLEDGYRTVLTGSTLAFMNEAVEEAKIMEIEMNVIEDDSSFVLYEYLEKRSQENIASIAPLEYMNYYVFINDKRGVLYNLPENIFALHFTMYFSKHTYLIDRFNLIIMNLRSQGLIEHWRKQLLLSDSTKTHHKAQGESIHLGDLKGVFYMVGMLLILSCTVFVLELFWTRV